MSHTTNAIWYPDDNPVSSLLCKILSSSGLEATFNVRFSFVNRTVNVLIPQGIVSVNEPDLGCFRPKRRIAGFYPEKHIELKKRYKPVSDISGFQY